MMAAEAPYRATPDLAGVLSRVVAVAFEPMPVVSWLVPQLEDRWEVLPRYFRILIDHAMITGRVETLPSQNAVAVWLPVGPGLRGPGASGPADYERRRAEACGGCTERFRLLDEIMHANHPPDQPHEHLALLAVRPGRQGSGLGSRLLEHRHRHLDAAGTPAYLEASTPRSAALYERHGYRHIGQPFAPRGCQAPMWPMWREPRPEPAMPAGQPIPR